MAIEYYDSLNIDSNDDSYFLGSVGIGTTSPGAKLQIGSATHAPSGNLANNFLQIKSSSGFAYLTIGNGDVANSTSYIGGASGFTVIGSVTDAGALSEHMRITNTGNVGIGTTSPTAPLDVRRSDASGVVAEFNNNVGYGLNINVESDGGNNTISSGTNQSLSFVTNGGSNERMRIATAGNVGIGTSSPNEKLQVAGNIHAYAPSGVNAEFAASTAAGSTTVAIRSSGVTHFNGGDVGIGTNSPAQKLDVNGNLRVTGDALIEDNIYLTDGLTAVRGKIQLNQDDRDDLDIIAASVSSNMKLFTESVERMRINSSGNVGIGTTSPGAKLQIGSATHAPSGNLANNLLQIKSSSGFGYLTIGNGDVANSTAYIAGASGLYYTGLGDRRRSYIRVYTYG